MSASETTETRNEQSLPKEEAVLRTLAPALRQLEKNLRAWLDGPHRFPLTVITRAALEGIVTDLRRKADDLDVDRPLLVLVLMGGTGVGKSTLLNALAMDQAIAQASVQRPTTRDPVVYYHESVRPDRLDPVLRHCRGRRRRAVYRLAGEISRQARLGDFPAAAQAEGVRLRVEQMGSLFARFCQRPPARRGHAPRPEGRGFRQPAAVPHLCPALGRLPDVAGRPGARGERQTGGPAGGRAVPRTGPLAGDGPDAAGDRGNQSTRCQPIAAGGRDVACPGVAAGPERAGGADAGGLAGHPQGRGPEHRRDPRQHARAVPARDRASFRPGGPATFPRHHGRLPAAVHALSLHGLVAARPPADGRQVARAQRGAGDVEPGDVHTGLFRRGGQPLARRSQQGAGQPPARCGGRPEVSAQRADRAGRVREPARLAEPLRPDRRRGPQPGRATLGRAQGESARRSDGPGPPGELGPAPRLHWRLGAPAVADFNGR
ncbi:MAG: 50S ribosome-binding GTPase [Planctomycetes bacterium]|nr:50S ribosome-binding GTPase [Planctomycetota bacterium]